MFESKKAKSLKKGMTLAQAVEMMGEDFILNALDKYLRSKERVRRCDKNRRARNKESIPEGDDSATE